MLEYEERIEAIHRSLGIPVNYGNQYGPCLQPEENDLIEIGDDIYGRPQKLAKKAIKQWYAMKSRAEKDGIILNVISAFRTVEKQTKIIQQKINAGQALSEILGVSAAPGYSEHHTGLALDLTTEESAPLSEEFDDTDAFKWLVKNAFTFSFQLSYPKNCKSGIAYEPWHWAYR